jgi:hypothetical protein
MAISSGFPFLTLELFLVQEGTGERGRSWEILGEVERFWEKLGEFGRFWENLGESGAQVFL